MDRTGRRENRVRGGMGKGRRLQGVGVWKDVVRVEGGEGGDGDRLRSSISYYGEAGILRLARDMVK